jgi:site-specific recombinase XerC
MIAPAPADPSVKQHLAPIKMLFDWLVTGQIVDFNPAAAVRGPKHVVKKGKTPVLTAEEARQLIDSIPTDSVVGLRDTHYHRRAPALVLGYQADPAQAKG